MHQPAPFFYYSQSFARLLKKLNITLVFSTYQAGRVVFVSSPTGETLYKFAKNFKRPMGMDVSENRLAVASRNYIEQFSMSPKLARAFPPKPGFYDAFYTPQVKYYTGISDMHEVALVGEDVWAVNTAFSCITKMSSTRHFEVMWQPDFITELAPEDRCHLNGMILDDGQPAYVTFFDTSNTDNGWRKTPLNTGVLYDCQQQKALVSNLAMPHSPLKDGDTIYFLQSATGEVMQYHLPTGKLTCIIKLTSFLRGMDKLGDYLFIGASKMRQESKTFKDLPISEQSFAGIEVVDLTTQKRVAGLTYTDKIKEIFEVKLIKNIATPLMLTEQDEGYERCISCGDTINYWLVEDKEKTNEQTNPTP